MYATKLKDSQDVLCFRGGKKHHLKGRDSTLSEVHSQLDNSFPKERRIFVIDWSNVVQTSQSK